MMRSRVRAVATERALLSASRSAVCRGDSSGLALSSTSGAATSKGTRRRSRSSRRYGEVDASTSIEVVLSPCQSSGFCPLYFDRPAQKYYHARLMSAAALIDGLEFAHALQELHGTLAVASLQRLEDVLFDTQGSLDYE